jgi:hypothetical protein
MAQGTLAVPISSTDRWLHDRGFSQESEYRAGSELENLLLKRTGGAAAVLFLRFARLLGAIGEAGSM